MIYIEILNTVISMQGTQVEHSIFACINKKTSNNNHLWQYASFAVCRQLQKEVKSNPKIVQL